MKALKSFAAVAIVTGMLGGCSSEPGPDLSKVLDRTSSALTVFQAFLKKNDVKKVEEAHLKKLETFMQRTWNRQPALHAKPLGATLLKDSTFQGFADANGNNIKDSGEKKLFKVQVDFEGKRLIATGEKSGSSVGMGLAGGMLAGMLMGRLMGNQRAAGVKPGSFANKKVTSRSSYARSRARSGGRFGGK